VSSTLHAPLFQARCTSLFRELKQTADLGRSFTADAHAVAALTYGAMLAHALVRSVRIQAALANEIPLEELRPLASLHVVRAYARDRRVAPAAASWWQMILNNDATARNMFVGTTCGLCGHSTDYDYGEHGL
jgi:hypothetical protein